MEGASVAPTIEPVAKMTAELAPVSACAAASRTTLDRARASLAISSVAVTSIIGFFVRRTRAGPIDSRHYGESKPRVQPAQTGQPHAQVSAQI
jgi:hypothetical protein